MIPTVHSSYKVMELVTVTTQRCEYWEDGSWNKGSSAWAVCRCVAPIFRKRPLAVFGGRDSAMEEANFLTK